MKLADNWPFKRIDLAAAAVMVAAAGAFYWFAIAPMLSLQDQHKAAIQQLDKQKGSVARSSARLDEVRSRLTTTRAAFNGLTVNLEPAGNVNSRIARLTSLAGKNSLKIDEVQPADVVYAGDYGWVPIVIKGTGSFATWASFLRQLAETCPDTAVDSFQIIRSPGTTTTLVDFHIGLIWYVCPQNNS